MNIVALLMLSIPTFSIPTFRMRKLKDSVESMRIWADGEPDQFQMYKFTHELLKKNNISDDT